MRFITNGRSYREERNGSRHGSVFSPFVRYNALVSNPRTCVVSFRDLEGMEHSVEVTAASLYEAAALGLKQFRSSLFAEEVRPGTVTKLKISVKQVESHHELTVGRLESWIQGGARSPRERVLKDRLRMVLAL